MNNAYFSSPSTMGWFWCKGSLPICHCNHFYLLKERCYRAPLVPFSFSSCCCSCCECCGYYTNRVAMSPRFLIGSGSRGLILSGADGYSHWSDKERRGNGVRRRRKGRMGERYGLGVDDAEEVISLISEVVGEECLCKGGTRVSLIKRDGMDRRKSCGGECCTGKKKNGGLGSLESDSKIDIESREEAYRRNEEREADLKCKNCRERKQSSPNNFGTDLEAQPKHGRFAEGSSAMYRTISRGDEDGRLGGKVRLVDDKEGDGEASELRRTRVRRGGELDWRDKSEKRHIELQSGETQSRKAFHEDVVPISQFSKQSTGRETNIKSVVNITPETKDERCKTDGLVVGEEHQGTSYEKTFSFQRLSENRMNSWEDKSALVLSTIQETEEQHHQTGERNEVSTSKTQKVKGISETKGQSDETWWDVPEPSIQESPKIEAIESPATNGDAIVRRTGRSLWNTIANIVRLRGGSQTETPNESFNSETWFSGREHKENSDENAKREISMPQEATYSGPLQRELSFSQSQGEVSKTKTSKENLRFLEADRSSSPSALESGSASKGISLASGDNSFGRNEDRKKSQQVNSTGIRRSSIVEEISEIGETSFSGSGSMKQPVGKLKLQRKKQVSRDRFDEWEEANKLESEQQKIDEMFMREALAEAKKGADTGEVPVGAVLVRQGKIIARAHNQVEKLQDSTAHAEMICIKEASHILKTWSLMETTLYVTLEPCPMCAGAILQARIDTLVWGAPNKLLGADGSWIRLFSNGGVGNDAELMDTPASPVHPFHPNIRCRVLSSECADVMQLFFQLRRETEKSERPPPHSCLPLSKHPSKLLTKMHHIFHIFHL